MGTLVAPATGSVLGAAFHIYDLILKANEYLRSQVNEFVVAPKISIYWEKGFNPNSYFGEISGLSYYIPLKKRLFILGGVSGNIDRQDTDHFDSSVILHEYGHFLEDHFAAVDSPGGSHSGNGLIDPRLAFSEGWGNFFQGAVLQFDGQSPRYVDTIGNEDGSTDVFVNIDLEAPDEGCQEEPLTSGCDIPILPAEGNFREFAITRFLWDTIDESTNGVADDDNVSGGFPEIWASLTAEEYARSSPVHFRSIGFFHQVQDSFLEDGMSTDWSDLRNMTQHHQLLGRREYAFYVDYLNGSDVNCESMNFEVVPYEYDGSFKGSHLLRNNDFFHFYHKESGDLTLTLNYITESGDIADLDLILYNSEASLDILDDIIDYSEENPIGQVGDKESEEITIKDLPAGDYLINIYVFVDKDPGTPLGGATKFELLGNGGVQLCPASLF